MGKNPKMSTLATHGILTREQVAKALGKTIKTLRRWEEKDGFPARTVGDTTLYDVEEIKKWIAARPKR